jgi:ABC-type transport system involved in multi-copper enzyme maturation permease subunit
MRLQHIWPIATNTVRESIRNKLLYTLVFFAVFVIAISVVIASLSYVEGQRIIQDVGLAAIRLFSVGIAVFVGIGLIHGEVERRTIYTILSKPISRSEFLVGKFLGLVLTVWMQLALMAIAFVVVSLASGAPLGAGHAQALAVFAAELIVVVAIATLFSSFTTPMLASLFTLGIYMAGRLSRDLDELGRQADDPRLTLAATWMYRLLPDLEGFDLSIQAVHGLPITNTEVFLPILYAIGYSTILLIAASTIFRRRDWK